MSSEELYFEPEIGPALAEHGRRADESPAAPFPVPAVSASLAKLAATGSSLGLLAATLALPSGLLADFIEHNRVPAVPRLSMFIGFAAGGAAAIVAALIFLAIRRRAGVGALVRTADLILPLSVAFLLPSLFSYAWHANPLPYLVQLAVFTVVLERTLRLSLAAVPTETWDSLTRATTFSPAVQRWLPVSVVVAGALFYSIDISYYTLLNHRRLNTAGYDLGIHVNWAYNAMHGHPLRCPVLFGPDGGNFIGNHAIFAMAFWLPLYALKPGSEVLLILQATIVGFAALTLYTFAKTQIPRWSAAVVAVLYLFYAPLHGPNFYDFHELLPPIFFHFLLYWAIATRRDKLVFVLIPVLYAFREDVAVGIAMLGMFLLVTGVRPKMGATIAIVSVVWFYLIKFEIMPRCWHTWFANIYKDLQAEGASGYGTVVETVLINPSYFLVTMLKEVKVNYFLHMFAPLAMLPARRPILLLLACPGFFFTLLTTGYAPTISIAFQYTTHWVPYLFGATVLMLRLLGREEAGWIRRRAALGAMSVAMISHSYVFGAILQHHTFVGGFNKVEFTMTPVEVERYNDLKALAAMIPQSASVAATENECPHIAARMEAFTLKDHHGDAEFILVNSQRMGLGSSTRNVQEVFSRAPYGLFAKRGIFYLFRRGHVSPETDSAKSAIGMKPGRTP